MRITPGTIVVGIFAVLFGLVGTYGVKQYLKPVEQPQAARPPAPIRLPFASADLEPGKTIKLGDIKILSMTADEAARTFPSGKAMTQAQQIIGRIVKEPILKDEAFLLDRLYPEGTGPNLEAKLQPGHRAVTIPVENAGALAGFATPGTIVDVLFRAKPGQKVPEATVTLVEEAEVLALGDTASPGGRSSSTATNVTLAVKSEDAIRLKAVEGHGDFSLSLRHREDERVAGDHEPLTLAKVLGVKEESPPQSVPPPRKREIEIFRGTAKEVVSFSRMENSRREAEPAPQAPQPPKPKPSAN
jgi:pilus assembly protein CpaB